MENYFNYFTEIEECFQNCRGTRTLLTALDWALIESWKEAGIPLEAALIGVDRAFQKFAKRPQAFRKVNGLAYCSQAVFQAAEELETAVMEGGRGPASQSAAAAPFEPDEVRQYVDRNAEALEAAAAHWRQNGEQEIAEDLAQTAGAIRRIAGEREMTANLEELENHLSALEEKLTAAVTRAAPVELVMAVRREVDKGLVPYRQRMTGPQIESLQRQFLRKRLFEYYRVPRLSLFYFQ